MLGTLSVDALFMEPPASYAAAAPADALVTSRIHHIRGQKVMLDRDLAELHGVETKQLKRQVRRNEGRFPEDFMFELTLEEAESSRSQIGTLKQGENIKYLPMAFTEQGVAMLSSVLGSEHAILVNIHIIRVFTRTCLPAGRCAKCCFRTGRSYRSWSSWKAASPVTMMRSKPFLTTSPSWSPRRSRCVNPSVSNPTKRKCQYSQ